jgi:putative oxygen-independent coproporphyrinogen III oxidase
MSRVTTTVGLAGAGHVLAAPLLTSLPSLALYVHVPWCLRKCPYCDFNSHEARGEVPAAAYVEALISDLDRALPAIWGRRVSTVFFGGGTPSLLGAEAIDAVISAVRARVPLAPDAEITLEANPGTAEAERFAGYRSAGVNRLSIGVQSFNPGHLSALGRVHDGREARRAIEFARDRFENFNLDLMYGLPGQTPVEALEDIRSALTFEPPHLSVYHLTIEPYTYFSHRPPPGLPDEDAADAIQTAIERALGEAGYCHYETSAYARAHRSCRHNLNYWTFGDYLGIGAGAHSKLSFAHRIVRQARYRQPARYMAQALLGDAVESERCLGSGDIAFEFMMNALRLNNGFPAALFAQRTGLPIVTVLPALERAERDGLILRDHERIAPTELGRRFLNDLLQRFLPESRGDERCGTGSQVRERPA